MQSSELHGVYHKAARAARHASGGGDSATANSSFRAWTRTLQPLSSRSPNDSLAERRVSVMGRCPVRIGPLHGDSDLGHPQFWASETSWVPDGADVVRTRFAPANLPHDGRRRPSGVCRAGLPSLPHGSNASSISSWRGSRAKKARWDEEGDFLTPSTVHHSE